MRRGEFIKPFVSAAATWPLCAHTRQRAILRRLGMAVCLALLASHPAAALDPVSLQLKWKHQFQFAGYYAALEQGFYRDAGLDVTIRERGPDMPVAEMASRAKAQFSFSSDRGLRGWRLVPRRAVLP